MCWSRIGERHLGCLSWSLSLIHRTSVVLPVSRYNKLVTSCSWLQLCHFSPRGLQHSLAPVITAPCSSWPTAQLSPRQFWSTSDLCTQARVKEQNRDFKVLLSWALHFNGNQGLSQRRVSSQMPSVSVLSLSVRLSVLWKSNCSGSFHLQQLFCQLAFLSWWSRGEEGMGVWEED